MPPKRRLPAEAATAFAQWIAQGAKWPEPKVQKHADQGLGAPRHWAFQRISNVRPPDIPDQSSRPIDRFIEVKR